MKRTNPSSELIVLSSLVVMGVYTVGYVLTQPAADRLRRLATTVESVPAGTYRDGIYLGEGSSPVGNVFVAVSISQHRIAAVWITAVTTSFPEKVIDPLTAEVVAQQSPKVDVISQATLSSAAFMQAVEVALSRARIV